MNGVLIVGAGGHAKVVADILQANGMVVHGFLDDDPGTWGQTRLGLPVLGAIGSFAAYAPDALIAGVGSNAARQHIVQKIEGITSQSPDALWCNAIHPRACVAPSAQVGHGLVVAAQAVINPDSDIGDHVVINTGATIDHDCRIGSCAHIAPGVHLAGNVVVEEGAFIGIGSVVIPGITIGCWAVIGAGSVVVRDVPARATAFGVPAKLRSQTS